MSGIIVETLTDQAGRQAALPALARLRIAVFREWPYLYDGSLDYERQYLRDLVAQDDAVLVVAREGETIVGVATASPMAGQDETLRQPFAAAGHDIARLFYFGESVLLPDYRGKGLGHRFFDARETAARGAGASAACFCAVIRPADHPLRPAGARTHDLFWRGRGYAPLPGLLAHYDWKDIDQAEETGHPMQFWHRTL